LQQQAVAAASEGNYPLPAWAYETLPAGTDAGTADAGAPIDASLPETDAAIATPGQATGGCTVAGRGDPFAAALALGLLRFLRRGSPSSGITKRVRSTS